MTHRPPKDFGSIYKLAEQVLEGDTSIGDQLDKERTVAIRLPVNDRIKVLSRDFINGKVFTLNRSPRYEVETLPTLAQKWSQRRYLSSAPAIKSKATVSAPPVSDRGNRLRLEDRGSSRAVQNTRSNLG